MLIEIYRELDERGVSTISIGSKNNLCIMMNTYADMLIRDHHLLETSENSDNWLHLSPFQVCPYVPSVNMDTSTPCISTKYD